MSQITQYGSGSTPTPGILLLTYTAVSHAQSPYTVVSGDEFIGVNATDGSVEILLPNAPATGRVYIVKDNIGISAVNNITITTVGGTVNIDGINSVVMNTAFEALQLLFNGTEYLLF